MEIITHCERETEEAGRPSPPKYPTAPSSRCTASWARAKTAFVRGMARGMGLSCRVSSPTFTIVNEYLGARTLLHFDMYRLSGAEELWDIGWDDYLDRGAVCAVEWSENVSDAFTGREISVRIEKLSPEERRISIEGGGF